MKIAKLVLKFIIVLSLILFIIFLYYNRNQSIDFSSKLPTSFKYCNKTINSNHPNYIDLKNWLKLNQENWKNNPASHMPVIYYYSPTISINIQKNRVIINYEYSNKNYHQVSREKKTEELIHICE